MASARFRLGYGPTSTGPWTWAAYDTAIDVTAGQYVKVELESTAGVESFVCDVPSGDEAAIAATLPVVTNDSASKTGVFQVKSSVGAQTLLVRVQINGGRDENDQSTWGRASQLAVHVLTCDQRLIAVGETDESDRTYYWAEKVNTAIRNSALVPAITATDPTDAALHATAIGTLVGKVVLAPLGTGADDWARLAAVVAVSAAGGWTTRLAKGTWQCKTAQRLPTELGRVVIDIEPGSEIVMSLDFPAAGTQENSAFYARATAGAKTGTLHGAATIGNSIITYDVATGGAPPAVGDIVAVSNALCQQEFIVRQVTGSSNPYTLYLNHRIVHPYQAGDPVSVWDNRPTVILRGHGCRVSGTGYRVSEIVGALNCVVEGFHYDCADGALGDIAFSYDIGGTDSVIRDCTVDGDGSSGTFYAGSLESCQNCRFERFTAFNPYGVGLAILDSNGCGFDDCHIFGVSGAPTSGCFAFGTGGGTGMGNVDCWMSGCSSSGGLYGLVLDDSYNTRIMNSSFNDAQTAGVIFNGAGVIHDTTFVAVDALRCAGTAFLDTNGGNLRTRAFGLNLSGAGTCVINSISELEVHGFTATGLSATMNSIVGSGRKIFKGGWYAHSGISNAFVMTGLEMVIEDMQISIGASSNALYAPSGGGKLHATRVTTAGSATGTTAVSVTNAAAYMNQCNFASVATQVTKGSGGTAYTSDWTSV